MFIAKHPGTATKGRRKKARFMGAPPSQRACLRRADRQPGARLEENRSISTMCAGATSASFGGGSGAGVIGIESHESDP